MSGLGEQGVTEGHPLLVKCFAEGKGHVKTSHIYRFDKNPRFHSCSFVVLFVNVLETGYEFPNLDQLKPRFHRCLNVIRSIARMDCSTWRKTTCGTLQLVYSR